MDCRRVVSTAGHTGRRKACLLPPLGCEASARVRRALRRGEARMVLRAGARALDHALKGGRALSLTRRRRLGHHAKVEVHKVALGGGQQVAGVRVCREREGGAERACMGMLV